MSRHARRHDLIALIEDTPGKHFETGRPLLLRRGQIGTVVMTYDGSVFEVKFADRDGKACAISPIDVKKLMRLRGAPDQAVG